MSNSCSVDRGFGQFGTLWSEMPTPLALPSGAPELNPQFVGGHLNAVWSVGPSNRPALLVSSWDPGIPAGLNWRVLRLVLFPSDGHPDGLRRQNGTEHFFLSALTAHCEYLDSDDNGSNSYLLLVRERTAQVGTWGYILRRVNIVSSNPAGVQRDDFPLLPSWLHEPSEVLPMGNLKIHIDRSNPTRAALVSTRGGSLRVSLLTLGQTVGATTTDFPSLLAGAVDPLVRLRVESVELYGSHLSLTFTGWRSSGRTQGLILRLSVTGAAVARNLTYGTDGLWESGPAYSNFRAVRECSSALVGIAGSKLVAMGVRPDGRDLDPGFGVEGIAAFELGGTLLDPAIAGEDRNGWIYFFAQRQSDLATVGARVRVATPLISVPNGTLDPAFGTQGLVTLKVDGYATAPGGLTLHDGAILDVALSRAIHAADTIRVPGIARMKLDGSLEAGFGSAGVARHGGSSSASAFGPDGSRVYAMTRASDNVTTVVWLDAEGRFERAAPVAPAVPSEPGFTPGVPAASVQIHPDGSLWVSGTGSSAWVVRLTAAANLDQTFGKGGVVRLRENDAGFGKAVLIGGRANGGCLVKVITLQGTFLCGLSSDGQLDPTFGQGGYTALPVLESGYLIRPDGSVLFPTKAGAPFDRSFGLSRVTSSGVVDPSFGVGNSPSTAPLSQRIVLTVPSPGSTIGVRNYGFAAIVERSGMFYAIGTADCQRTPLVGLPDPPIYHFILITRWNQDGTVDTTYESGGAVFYGEDSGYLDWTCRAVAAEAGQPITLAGSAAGRPAIWQLTKVGTLDTGFGPGGVCSLLLQEVTRDDAFAIAVLPGGKVRIACSTGIVQFVLTSPPVLPSISVPRRIIERVLRLFGRGPAG